MGRTQLVYRFLTLIPKGKVTTYAQTARVLGISSPRLIGLVLHRNPNPRLYPCHRVVSSSGKLSCAYAFGGLAAQKERLEREGVVVNSRKVDLKNFGWKPHSLLKHYFNLLAQFGLPGPWPWYGDGPAHSAEEILIGAVLTQNTNWRNVEYALSNLKEEGVCSVRGVYELGGKNIGRLKSLVRPSGFYNQKAESLLRLCRFIVEKYSNLNRFLKLRPAFAREALLSLKGIGPETADTILLFAGNKPIFVIDNYTKKFVGKFSLMPASTYEDLRKYFEENLPQNMVLYQDFHALIVKWGKEEKFNVK